MKNSLAVLAILFLSASCNIPAKKEKAFNLTPSQSFLSFPIDSTTSTISTGLTSFGDYLINVNWNTNSLQFYNLRTQILEKETFFPREGPEGVGSLFGIHVQSLDSIFLFPQISKVIILTDTSGQILNRISYGSPDTYTGAFVHNAYFGSSPLIQGNSILVKTHIQGNYREMTEEKLIKSALAYSINLMDGSTTTLDLTYPEGYLQKGLKHFEASLVFQQNFTVYSLFGDHRVFKQNQDGTLETFNGKSQFLDETLSYFPIDGERMDTYKYLSASSRYESIIYDSYREVYYRFAFPTLPIESEDGLRSLRENPGPFVIQVFNSDLQLLTERFFEGGIYFPNNSFITQEGLFISINNPSNPASSEDLFQFQRIDLLN
ncbi:DUF4221 family protein [Algoriphagus namhaensis]